MNKLGVLCAVSLAVALFGCAKANSTGSPAVADAARGKEIFTDHCSSCHGPTGREGGSTGPSIAGERQHMNVDAAIVWIKNPAAPMPKLYPDPLSDRDVADVAAYVETL